MCIRNLFDVLFKLFRKLFNKTPKAAYATAHTHSLDIVYLLLKLYAIILLFKVKYIAQMFIFLVEFPLVHINRIKINSNKVIFFRHRAEPSIFNYSGSTSLIRD